jgi:hypothetical protein
LKDLDVIKIIDFVYCFCCVTSKNNLTACTDNFSEFSSKNKLLQSNLIFTSPNAAPLYFKSDSLRIYNCKSLLALTRLNIFICSPRFLKTAHRNRRQVGFTNSAKKYFPPRLFFKNLYFIFPRRRLLHLLHLFRLFLSKEAINR